MMRTRIKQHTLLAVTAGTLAMAMPAQASENGTVQYGLGSAQFFSGAIPPLVGLYMNNQFSYYSADQTNGDDGHKNDFIQDFDSDIVLNTFRLLYVSDKELMNGKVWYQAVFPLMLKQKIEVDTPFGSSDTDHHGLADPAVTIGLRWGEGKHTYTFGLEGGLNIGTDSVSMHHWSVQPTVGYHYLDFRNPDWEVGFIGRYIINTKNTETDYRSGNQFVADYGVGYYFGPLRVGITGYWLKQTTDDSGSATSSNRTDAFAIGPSLKWSFKDNSLISASYQKETYAKNKSKGDAIWINYARKF